MVESRSSSLSVNQLNILRLTRDYHNTRLTCVASNNNVTEPSMASVTVTMNREYCIYLYREGGVSVVIIVVLASFIYVCIHISFFRFI